MSADNVATEWAKCSKHNRMRGNQSIWFNIKNESLRRIQTKIGIPEEPCDLCLTKTRGEEEVTETQ